MTKQIYNETIITGNTPVNDLSDVLKHIAEQNKLSINNAKHWRKIKRILNLNINLN